MGRDGDINRTPANTELRTVGEERPLWSTLHADPQQVQLFLVTHDRSGCSAGTVDYIYISYAQVTSCVMFWNPPGASIELHVHFY